MTAGQAQAPLAARMRPRSLDEMVGQDHLIGPGASLRTLIEADRLTSLILWGPPGTGKTTLAHVIARSTGAHFVSLSAVSAGVKDVREVVEAARLRRGRREDQAERQGRLDEAADAQPGGREDTGGRTILFLDEVHRFNKAQQDALLPSVEEGLVIFIGATTENPFFELNAPLLSRSVLFRLEPLSQEQLRTLVDRALGREGAEADLDAIDLLVDRVDGDSRAVLTSLELAMSLAPGRRITRADVEAARGRRALQYGRDDHYDVISAFIKSVRGSDADAGLYWLARMLEAGEDARFIARRLVILASEDVGLADSRGLLVADAAARAVEFVGLPEAQLNLAHAVVYLAAAPKSNRAMAALGRARADVADRPAGPVPAHLRDAHHPRAKSLGHGVGYEYPHDHPRGWVAQDYRPSEVADRRYYEPSGHGEEREIDERMRSMRRQGDGR